jgi:microtubule-associated protein-like 1/2
MTSTTAADIANDNAAIDINHAGGGSDGGADDTAPRSEQIANNHANNSVGTSSSVTANNHVASRRGSLSIQRKAVEDDDDEGNGTLRPPETGGGGSGCYWGAASRPSSPGVIMGDIGGGSEASSIMPPPSRPKSRLDQGGATSKYNNLSYWRARKVLFYKNGDPFFPGVEFRFKPGRDIVSLESLLDRLSLRMDLPRGARFVFSMDGDRKLRLEELEDGASYVVSSYKTFKVSGLITCNASDNGIASFLIWDQRLIKALLT